VPNARTHATVGAVTGLAAWMSAERNAGRSIRLGDLVIPAIAGLLSGLLADFIEPATNPNHRGFAHSLMFVVLVAAVIFTADPYLGDEKRQRERTFLACIASAYFSHLLLDSFTAKGLPIC
jgi:membrane-bound metal-dependent hydrolase YbcI (DUF457 family)